MKSLHAAHLEERAPRNQGREGSREGAASGSSCSAYRIGERGGLAAISARGVARGCRGLGGLPLQALPRRATSWSPPRNAISSTRLARIMRRGRGALRGVLPEFGSRQSSSRSFTTNGCAIAICPSRTPRAAHGAMTSVLTVGAQLEGVIEQDNRIDWTSLPEGNHGPSIAQFATMRHTDSLRAARGTPPPPGTPGRRVLLSTETHWTSRPHEPDKGIFVVHEDFSSIDQTRISPRFAQTRWDGSHDRRRSDGNQSRVGVLHDQGRRSARPRRATRRSSYLNWRAHGTVVMSIIARGESANPAHAATGLLAIILMIISRRVGERRPRAQEPHSDGELPPLQRGCTDLGLDPISAGMLMATPQSTCPRSLRRGTYRGGRDRPDPTLRGDTWRA